MTQFTLKTSALFTFAVATDGSGAVLVEKLEFDDDISCQLVRKMKAALVVRNLKNS